MPSKTTAEHERTVLDRLAALLLPLHSGHDPERREPERDLDDRRPVPSRSA